MSKNAIAISRSLAAAGLEPKAADAVAEAIVTHSDDQVATKADIAELHQENAVIKGKIEVLETKLSALEVKIAAQIAALDGKFRIMYGLVSSLFVAIIISALIR